MSEHFRKFILYILIISGVFASANLLLYCWRTVSELGITIAWPLLLAYFLICVIFQFYFVWYLYCCFQKKKAPKVLQGHSVDVFITAYDEPIWILERTLCAAMQINYPHRTYLLDDSPNYAYKKLADRLDSEYLTRERNHNYKAGNINAALKKTSGDFVAIFDADHFPKPEFLDRTLGFFNDERIGFVQVMQTFCNSNENFIAEASAQTAMEYFNITAVCKDSVDATSLHGTNAVIRRKALDTIGGYQPGLAEDLETSLALHGQGWKSAYVCEPLAPGLVPASFWAYCRQQLKWSKGVFEAARRSLFDGTFFRLTWHQKLAYCVRFSYYTVGPSLFLGMVLTTLYLTILDSGTYEGFLARLLPIGSITIVIRWFMLRTCATEPAAIKGVHFKGVSIISSVWPIYLLSLICTITRIPIAFMSTPKDTQSPIKLWTIMPQIGMIIILVAAIIWKLIHWQQDPAPFTLLTALLLVGQQWILLIPIWQKMKGIANFLSVAVPNSS